MGAWDLLVYICTDTAAHFHKTVKEIKREFPDVLTRYDAWVAYREHFFQNFPPIIEATDTAYDIINHHFHK